MRIADLHWMQLAEYLRHDDRVVVPLGSTEQHGYLSLSTDSILAERVALEAAEPLGIPVLPVLAYGIAPYFLSFPGSLSLRISTYLAVARDILDSLAGQGFRRIILVNGHGGNSPVGGLLPEWLADHSECRAILHNWWNAPRTWAAVQSTDPLGSHASWMENFPWTRITTAVPTERKPMVDMEYMRSLPPQHVKDLLGDGNFGGDYYKDDQQMLEIWRIGVEETRTAIEHIRA